MKRRRDKNWREKQLQRIVTPIQHRYNGNIPIVKGTGPGARHCILGGDPKHGGGVIGNPKTMAELLLNDDENPGKLTAVQREYYLSREDVVEAYDKLKPKERKARSKKQAKEPDSPWDRRSGESVEDYVARIKNQLA